MRIDGRADGDGEGGTVSKELGVGGADSVAVEGLGESCTGCGDTDMTGDDVGLELDDREGAMLGEIEGPESSLLHIHH